MERGRAAGPPVRAGEFVRRVGSVLLLDGKPFRFHGNNVYYNQADIVYGRAAGVAETFDKMAALGMTVVRANAHNDHPPSSDPAAIQTEPGVLVESSLVALDRSIAMARERGLRLILKLTNNWEAYGGIRRYVQWHLGRAPQQNEWGLFYTEERIRGWYKSYARAIIERRNTVTGVLYRDEPAILAWELGNELRNPSAGRADALVAWHAEMAAYIKSIDANHLIADGGEGFDDDASLYAGLSNRYAVAGSEGCSYHRLARIPEIDMLSYHLYPSSWQLNEGADTELFIRRHEEIARGNGKVAYLGEYGKRAPDAERAGVFDRWLRSAVDVEASSGVMVWQLINDSKNDSEGYQVYCPQHSVSCGLMQSYSERLAASPALVSAASFRAGGIAAGSLATMFLPKALGDAASLRVTVGGREAATFLLSPSQINFLVPAETPDGGNVVRVMRGSEVAASAVMTIARSAPGVFMVDGKAVGQAVIVDAAGGRRDQSLFDAVLEIPRGGSAVLVLYGTGLRGAREWSATIGGRPAEVAYVGPQPEFAGLDQINVAVPEGVTGVVEVVLRADGDAANAVTVAIK